MGAAALAFAGALSACSGGAQSISADAPTATSVGTPPESPKRYEQVTNTIFVFDTVVTLTAYCSQETLDAACERCNYFESIFSRTIETSDIGRINLAGGAPVEVAPETADIVSKALAYSAETEGRFDISIGTVSTLWDFNEGVLPEPSAVREAVKHVDYTKVHVEGNTVTLEDPQAKLDLGAIAKGYIADDLHRLFVEAGCDSGIINLGGNTKCIGLKPDGSQWHVGIQDPNAAEGEVVAAVYSHDSSIVTSGLYERQFTKAGKRYWHILDPQTGYPVETDLVSASVLSQASIEGDVYATQLFMMGHDDALRWIEAKDGIEGLVVDEAGAIAQSAGCEAELR